jgi:K+-transporting ATPase A subunit
MASGTSTSAFTGSGFGGAYRALLAIVFLLLAAFISGLVVGRSLFRLRRSASSMWGIMLVFQALTGAMCLGIFTLFYLLWPR